MSVSSHASMATSGALPDVETYDADNEIVFERRQKRYSGEVTYSEVTDTVLNIMNPPQGGWWVLLLTCISMVGIGAWAWTTQIINGIGESGKSNPIMWGFYITTFVFWVGIAHSGTLISAVLYLFRAKFRMPIYRLAEAMTVFAVLTAGLFPLIHLGRVWFFYWLMP